jgi:hypothetical protein
MKKLSLFLALTLALTAAPFAHAETSREPTITIKVTPTVSNAVAYTANDQVGGVQTLTNVAADSKSGVTLYDLAIVDLDNQKAAMDIFFFDQLPSPTSVDNGAFTITAADAGKLVGHVVVAASDYKSSASQAVASVGNIWKIFNPSLPTGAVTGITAKNLYAIAVTRGTPTYTGTSKLTFIYKFLQN